MVSKIDSPITPLEQTEKINEIIDNLGRGGVCLLDHKWSDHLLNDQNWLRADTFSWHPATTQYGTYLEAYNHLVDDYTNGTSTTETVGSYTITYVLADDGHKITTDETTVANIYNESGVAWYYILDTANQRFKLPRENPAKEVLGQSAPILYGDMIKYHVLTQSDYSNAKGKKAVLIARSAASSEAYVGYGDSTQTNTGPSLLTDLTQETGVYKGKQYLYFYVGQFSQSATEQTAGLNSELFNGKLDLDAGNATSSTKETIVGWGMPDYSSQIALSTGTTEQTYTAPSKGYIGYSFLMNGNTTGYVKVNGVQVISNHPAGGNYFDFVSGLIPVDKNDVIKYYSNQTSGAFNNFQFYPVKGI